MKKAHAPLIATTVFAAIATVGCSDSDAPATQQPQQNTQQQTGVAPAVGEDIAICSVTYAGENEEATAVVRSAKTQQIIVQSDKLKITAAGDLEGTYSAGTSSTVRSLAGRKMTVSFSNETCQIPGATYTLDGANPAPE